MEEEDAEFHTPPEHQTLSHFSSSEDQNPPGFSAEKPPPMAEIGCLMNNGEAELGAINGNCDSSGNLENKPNETGDSSGDFESPKIVGDRSCLKVRLRIRGFQKGVEIAKNADEITKAAEMQKDGHGNEGAGSSGGRIKEKSGKRSKKRRNEGMRSSGKRSKKRKKMQEDGHGNEGGRSSGKQIVEIEDFRYVGDDDGKRRKLSSCLTEAGKSLEKENGLRPPLEEREKDLLEGSEKNSGSPPLLEVNEDMGKSWEKQKDVGESWEKKSERQEFLDLLGRVKPFLENKDGGNEDEDVDYIQAAKDRGMSFVEPRIWKRLRRD